MATASPYMPDAQADFDGWLVSFSTLTAAEPFRYGLLRADAIAAVTAG